MKQALERLAGVKSATADRTKNEARVVVEGNGPAPQQMIAAVQGAGRFQAQLAA